eukprot:SAG31_NODE_4470_length_3205_cov_70.394915_5_plen_40_part_00
MTHPARFSTCADLLGTTTTARLGVAWVCAAAVRYLRYQI